MWARVLASCPGFYRGLGHEVVAVEPDDHMRARLAEVSTDIVALAGTAEEIPAT